MPPTYDIPSSPPPARARARAEIHRSLSQNVEIQLLSRTEGGMNICANLYFASLSQTVVLMRSVYYREITANTKRAENREFFARGRDRGRALLALFFRPVFLCF